MVADLQDSDLKEQFLQGMSCAAATVNVVTTNGPAGKAGLTVSAMTSISADTAKPTLLVCVNEKSAGAQPLIDNGVFALNVLRDTQSHISDTFAGRFDAKGREKFDCASWYVKKTGSPLLEGAVVSFDCKVVDVQQIGTHFLIIGEVEMVNLAESGNALIYVSRNYSKTQPLVEISRSNSKDNGPERNLKVACLDSFGPMFLPRILDEMKQQGSDTNIEIFEGNQKQVAEAVANGDVDVSILYDQQLPAGLAQAQSGEIKPYFLLPRDHDFAEADAIRPEQLADEDFILLDTTLSPNYFLEIFEHLGIEPKISMRSRSLEMTRSLVGRGFGYSMLVSKPHNFQTYDGMEIAAVDIDGAVPAIRMVCAARPENIEKQEVKGIIELCRKLF